MGKNNRHKKRLKSEKSKTKLKTKFLPKGQNVTNTTFKIKPIVIPTQLQTTKISDEGTRNLDFKDVLSRLRHYNENMKVRACEDMEYVIKNDKFKLSGGNVSLVVQSIAEFVQVKTPKARKAGLSLTKLFFQEFPLEQIAPYFHYFSVNLRCAMTHIDRNIQEDSIRSLDILLEFAPGLMAKYSHQILPDFLTLVSRLKSDADFKRTVTVNLKSKFTSAGWRIIVFSRLYAFLQAIVGEAQSEDLETDLDIDRCRYNRNTFSGLLKTRKALLNPTEYIVETKDKSGYSLNEQLSALVPLLLETWLEGTSVKQQEVTHLTEENAMLLNCVIKVFHLLWDYLNRNKAHDKVVNDGEKLIKQLVQNFPFTLNNSPKQVEKTNKFLQPFTVTDNKCTQENLLICYLLLMVFRNKSVKSKSELDKIVNYVNDCLSKNRSNSNYLVSIVKLILHDEMNFCKRNNVAVERILENTIVYYQKGNSHKTALFKLLTSINDKKLLTNTNYNSWLNSLPKLLTEKSVSETVIDSMFDISRKNLIAFNESYFNCFPSILKNLPRLKVTDSNNPDEAKLKVIDILFYLPPGCNTKSFPDCLPRTSPYRDRIDFVLTSRNYFDRN